MKNTLFKLTLISLLSVHFESAVADPIVDSNPALIQKLQQRRENRMVVENRMNSGSNPITTQPTTTTTVQGSTTTVVVTTTSRPTTTVVADDRNQECYQSESMQCSRAGYKVSGYDYNNASSNPKPYKCCSQGFK